MTTDELGKIIDRAFDIYAEAYKSPINNTHCLATVCNNSLYSLVVYQLGSVSDPVQAVKNHLRGTSSLFKAIGEPHIAWELGRLLEPTCPSKPL